MIVANKERTGDTRSHQGGSWWIPQPWVDGPIESERPEAQLLFASARTTIDSIEAEQIKLLVSQVQDWSFVIEKAQQNCVMPLLCWNILNLCPELVPQEILFELRSFFSTHARRNLSQTAALIELVSLFETNNIPTLPFKGPLLATSVYGNLSFRQFCDLDILVHQHNITKAIELLLERGYTRSESENRSSHLSPSELRRKDLVLTSEDGRVRVELHWRLSGTYFDFPVDIKNLWRQLDLIELGGHSFNGLARNELLLYLCMHGTRHGWERLGWVCDVAELLRSNPDFDWPTVITQAHLLGCERALMLALLLADELLDADIPVEIRQKIQNDADLKFISANAREWFFRQPGDSHKLSDWYLYHLSMKERSRDKVRLHLHYHLRYLRLALTPNQKDHKLVLLPASFSFLYYVVRPVRLANELLLTPIKKLFKQS